MKPLEINKGVLQKLYIEDGKSCTQIAKQFNTHAKKISRYLQKFGIQARPFSTKGLVAWNVGVPMKPESREKLRKFHLGRKQSKQTNEKIRKWMLENKPFEGKHHTEESKQKQRDKMVGRKLSPEHRAKVLKALKPYFGSRGKGFLNQTWRGGISSINARLRRSKEYMNWANAVKERDGYKCAWCGKVNKSNHADHIAPFSLFPELRFSVDNGRTLCAECHRKTDTFGFKSVKVKNKI